MNIILNTRQSNFLFAEISCKGGNPPIHLDAKMELYQFNFKLTKVTYGIPGPIMHDYNYIGTY